LVLTWNWPIDPDSPAPRVLPWLAAVLPWVLAPVLSWVVLRLKGNSRVSGWKPIAVLSVGVVVLASIATRPAAAWTATRAVTTQIGVVQPNSGAGAGAGAADTSVDSMPVDRSAAAAWLSGNAAAESIVATTNTVSGFLPAVTGLRTYLSGQLYQAGLGAAGSRAEVERRVAVIEGLLSAEWETALVELCDAGVDYFWVEGSSPLVAQADASFAAGDVMIVSRAGACS
jgi:hypothetical protein